MDNKVILLTQALDDIDKISVNAAWKDVLYEAYIRQEIEEGLDEARRGEFASDDELVSAFAKWGVSITTRVV